MESTKAQFAMNASSAPRWLLFTENPYAFAVALTALAQTGCVAVLPPNSQRETLHELAEGCVGLLSDQADLAIALPTIDPLAPGKPEATVGKIPFVARALDANALLLEICTSGSTGQRKRVPKCVRQIDAELTLLEKVFGESLPADTQFFATASHQHFYGFLFRVLWPLVTGRPFRLESFLYPEEILPRMAQTNSCALVSTPAHLKRLKDVSGLETLRSKCRVLFSSGGPLSPEVASALARALGEAPIEIFGSTETGGVAWRKQSSTPSGLAWTTLPGVEIERMPSDGRLRVHSPFASSESDGSDVTKATCEMGDCIELLTDGRFLVRGRADRIVKIGEKRLALPEMEARLLENSFLQEVALLPLERSDTTRVGAVAVLSDAGQSFLTQHGRRALAQSLTQNLQTRFDRIVLPRAWRYVTRLPEDAQGKVTQSLLRALFEASSEVTEGREKEIALDGGTPEEMRTPSTAPNTTPFDPQSKTPLVFHEERSETSHRRRCRVPENLASCDGHFPMNPIVPGVVQLDWVMTAARDVWENLPTPIRIEALKFKTLLLPGQEFELALQRTGSKLSFTLRNVNPDGEIFSSGRFVLPSDGEKEMNAHEMSLHRQDSTKGNGNDRD